MLIRKTLLILTLATAALAQAAGELGTFEGATDVGKPARKGSVAYDSAKGEYRITGGGTQCLGQDRRVPVPLAQCSPEMCSHHRDDAIRRHQQCGAPQGRPDDPPGLEPDAPYVDATVHGDGLTSLQFRETAGDITRGVNFPVVGPTQIRLERVGNLFSMWTGKEGGPLQEAGSVPVALGKAPVYAGLYVCSHNPQNLETVVFSNVTIENLPAATKKAQ